MKDAIPKGAVRCIFCGFICNPSGFGSHCCKKAPTLRDVGLFTTTGSRRLTLGEIQMCRMKSGLKPSPRIARELAKTQGRNEG